MKTMLTQLCATLLLAFFLNLNHKKNDSLVNKPIEKDATKAMCSEGGLLNASVISKEELNQNGSFSLSLRINATDTITIDSITYSGSAYFAVSMGGVSGNNFAASPAFSTINLLPTQQSTATVSATYNASQLPYYPKDIEFKVWAHNAHNSIDVAIAEVKVYFTPYNTTEIWDIADFVQLPRVWSTPLTPEPIRVSIAKSSIPVSTRPDLSTLTAAWQTDFQEKFVAGLPYSVLMEAIHPDTILARHIADSLASDTGVLNKGVFGRTFTGTITGRLSASIINDDGVPATLYPAGVEVKLWEEDAIRQEFGITQTDANGYFSISYEKWQSHIEGDDIELYLEIYTRNSQFDLQVVENGPINSAFNTNYKQHYWLGSKGTSYTENINWQYVGDPFKVLHWAYKGFEFSQLQIGNGAVSNNLRVKIYQNSSDFSSVLTPRIRLENGDEKHETVIWHEFGHYAMYRLQNGYYVPCSYGSHSSSEESQNHNLAWSEGWATGYMAMIDKFYQSMDGEFGFYAFYENPNVFARYNLERRSRTKFEGNGLRNEYVISCALYDLYDGPSRFPSNTAASEYNDIASVNTVNNNGYEPNLFDDIELTAAQICAPLRNGSPPQSVADYYYKLLANANCSDKNKISKVFSQNAVRPNTADASTSLSADNIGLNRSLVTFGCLLNATRLETFYKVEKDVLNGANESWNFGALNTFQSADIVENLIVQNGAILGINNDLPIGFATNTVLPNSNTSILVSTCANTIYIDNGGILEIGRGTKIGALSFTDGSYLIIKSGGTLDIRLGSKLILDGGTLVIEQGANINLQDLESIIEIQDGGRIIIGNNATFNWTGNGHIVVNNNPNQLGKVNITASINAQNARVDIAGTWVNGQGFTQKLIEVVSGSLSIDRSISNVSIARGQIHLGENAIVDVEPICYFDNITFDPIQTGNKHGGLWVYGQQNTPYINNCTFNNATTGVTVFPLVNGVGIKNNLPVSTHSKFTNSNFLNCDRAIFVDARGAEIANCYITGTNNHQGILLRGIQYSSFIDQSTSRYHQIGADLIGNYHTETSVKRSSIYNNSTAGIMNRSSKLTLGCDQIYNNASTTNAGYNIWLKPGTRMFAENSMAFGSTYNDLSNQNSASMYLENAFGFNIHNGYNNFNTQNNYGILGQMIPNSVSVSNNPLQWDASTVTNVSNNYWNSMGTSPVLLQDYSIAYNDGWTIYLKYLDDMNQSLGMPPNITGNCAIGIIGNDPPSPFLGKTMIDDANNIGFDQIYKNALYQRFNGAYADAYNNFKLIAVYNYDTAIVLLGGDNIITSEFREWFDVVMLSYSEMMATLYDGFAAGVFDSSFVVSNINSQIQQEILNKFEATNETDTTVNYYFVKYQFDFDNCMLNRLVGNYNSAIAGLSQMQNGVHIDANSEMISYYKCLSEKEQYMISATSLDKQELRSIYYCDTLVSTPYFGPPITINQTGLSKKDLTSNKMTLYPIPFQNNVNVIFASELNIEDVKIYDVSGRLVYQKIIDSKKSNLNLELNLDNGTYFINVKTNNGTFTEKLIK
jgi:hypothetical protein